MTNRAVKAVVETRDSFLPNSGVHRAGENKKLRVDGVERDEGWGANVGRDCSEATHEDGRGKTETPRGNGETWKEPEIEMKMEMKIEMEVEIDRRGHRDEDRSEGRREGDDRGGGRNEGWKRMERTGEGKMCT